MAIAGLMKNEVNARQTANEVYVVLLAHPMLNSIEPSVEASQTVRRPYRLEIGLQKRGAHPSTAICNDTR